MFQSFATLPPTIVAALCCFAVVAGLARGFSGFGAGLIFIPLAGMVAGPRIASPLLLVIDMLGAIGTVPEALRRSHKRPVLMMAAAAMIAIPGGTAVLLHADPVAVRWAVGVIVLVLLAVLIRGRLKTGADRTSLLLATGGLSGILSGLAQIGGPPIVVYWLGSERSPAEIRANVMFFFLLTGLTSLVVYGMGGLLGRDVLFLALFATPSYAIGVWIGTRLFRLADALFFRRVSMILIAAAAVLGLPIFDGWLH